MKRILILFMVIVMAAFAFACDSGGGQLTDDFETKEYSKDKQFTFFADLPPITDKTAIEVYKEAGFNAFNVIPWPEYQNSYDKNNPEGSQLARTLELLEDLELDAFIRGQGTLSDSATRPSVTFPGIDLTKYPAFKGMYIVDEPHTSTFATLGGSVATYWNDTFAGKDKYWHLNLFPSYASSEQLGAEASEDGEKTAYEVYVDKYVDEVLTKVEGKKGIGMDHYMLRSTAGEKYTSEMFIFDLITVAKAAKASGATLHNCIQASYGHGQTRPLESSAEAKWQYYISMAFGAKVFEVFAYLDAPDINFSCMMGARPNDMYYYHQEAMEEIKKFGHVFCSFDWEGVKTFVGSENPDERNGAFEILDEKGAMTSLAGIKKVDATQDTIIGQLKDGNDKGYLVMNYTDPSHNLFNMVNIEFEKCDKVVVYRNGEEIKYRIKNNKLELPLIAGEGVFVIPVK